MTWKKLLSQDDITVKREQMRDSECLKEGTVEKERRREEEDEDEVWTDREAEERERGRRRARCATWYEMLVGGWFR